ncbi:Efflux pump [Lachnellula subtilissima]|uniref:Efflux pump n=1 Tax=Lachnellula subtilissima TaxID=602034 RepID=A0A8H8U7H8_9HELO|nr:Efflux pump [Lachnellula subtilissima]
MDSPNTKTPNASEGITEPLPQPLPKPEEELQISHAEDGGGSGGGRQIHGFKWVLVISSVLTSTFLFGLDTTIVADIQPAIISEFNAIKKLPWISVAFLLLSASTTLFWGQVYGQYNTKVLYITCVLIFEIGSIICGATQNIDGLIVGRAICGLGGTGMYTGALTLLSIFPAEHERSMYIGLTGLTWGTGMLLGPIIGGAFTSSSATWRWGFYLNPCVAALYFPVYIFILPSFHPRPMATRRERFSEIDVLSTILLTGAYLALLMAIQFGGVIYPWGSARIIALFVVGFVLAMAFLAQQTWSIGTSPSRRAFPLQFLRSRSLCILFILEACASSMLFVAVYFIPLYFQFIRHDSAIRAGVRLIPLIVFMVFTIVLNGIVMSRYGRYMPWFFAGGALGLIGSALLFTIGVSTSAGHIYGYSILVGAGAGCFLQLPFSVVQALVEPHLIPKAIGFVTLAQLSAPGFVLAVINAVFLNEAAGNITKALSDVPRKTVMGILSGVGSAAFERLDERAQGLVLGYIVKGLGKGYIVAMTSGGLAIVLSVFLPRGKMLEGRTNGDGDGDGNGR